MEFGADAAGDSYSSGAEEWGDIVKEEEEEGEGRGKRGRGRSEGNCLREGWFGISS